MQARPKPTPRLHCPRNVQQNTRKPKHVKPKEKSGGNVIASASWQRPARCGRTTSTLLAVHSTMPRPRTATGSGTNFGPNSTDHEWFCMHMETRFAGAGLHPMRGG